MPLNKIEFVVREIRQSDLQKGFFKTLSNLTKLGNIPHDHKHANLIYNILKSSAACKTFVAVKVDDEEVIGSVTLILEQKFIHDGGICAHLGDVVTRKGYERIGVASSLIKTAVEFAKKNDCYKIILNCRKELKKFYENNGFSNYDMIAMTMYLKECTCSDY